MAYIIILYDFNRQFNFYSKKIKSTIQLINSFPKK